TKMATALMEIDLKNACLAVVGATGSIGGACAQILAPEVGKVRLVGRNKERLTQVTEKVRTLTSAEVIATDDISASLREADIVITVTGAIDCVIHPEDIKRGAVVCDVARPRDVSKLVSEVRNDVLVIDGGVVKVPGEVNFNFNFGLPKGMAEGCMAETMILTLEKRYENYTLGKDISIRKAKEMNELAKKHGFKVAALRRFERAITPSQIEQVKLNAKIKS
ncbi:MAG: NAD(P)H-binding protein, partial [Candidatus Subteraquimicrobiales bacterium]|nr:NAD(P)H-binding protein [Candidatus Subteraquimicrobiales bacterium]